MVIETLKITLRYSIEALSLREHYHWERLVECVKLALLLNLGSAKFTPDIFATIVSEDECLVNSRPLTHVKQPWRRQPAHSEPFLAWKTLLQGSWSRLQRDTYLEEFRKDTGEAETSADLEKSANQVCYVPSLNKRQKWTTCEAALEVDAVV